MASGFKFVDGKAVPIEEDEYVGLGDVVEKITTFTGVKKVVEALTPEGKDCGCDKRKTKMNKVKLYKK